MPVENKTPLEHVNDTLTQLRQMRDHLGNNVERLSTQWLLFDGELNSLQQTARIEHLMVRVAELHEALEAEITELERITVTLQPAREDGSALGTMH